MVERVFDSGKAPSYPPLPAATRRYPRRPDTPFEHMFEAERGEG
jgi:hypothetical protein